MFDEDALKGAEDVESGDKEGTPVHSPTIPDDEGNPGDGSSTRSPPLGVLQDTAVLR